MTALAVAWVLVFCGVFYSQRLPNNPASSRLDVWELVPTVLLDFVDPPVDPDGPDSGWKFFPQRFEAIGTALLMLFGAWGSGVVLLRLLGLTAILERLERIVFAFALGFTLLSLGTLLCGLAGCMPRWLAIAAMGGCGLAGMLAAIVGTTPQVDDSSIDHAPATVNLRVFCCCAMAAFLVCMFFGALSPSVEFDVREYHLQGPKEYFQAGRISFLPHNVYTSFPFLSEMLSLLGMIVLGDWNDGALAGKLVLMSFAPLSALAVWALARAGVWIDRGVAGGTRFTFDAVDVSHLH